MRVFENMNFKKIFCFYFKKYFCLNCNTRLKPIKISKLINLETQNKNNLSKKDEDKKIENVKITKRILECPLCHKQFTAEEIMYSEQQNLTPEKRQKIGWKIPIAFFVCFIIFFMFFCFSYINVQEEPALKNELPVKYIYQTNPFYLYFKKHYCLNCGQKLEIAYNSIIVNSESPEAENYDFSIAAGDTYLTGDVEFRIGHFNCSKCGFSISFDDMRKHEKQAD